MHKRRFWHNGCLSLLLISSALSATALFMLSVVFTDSQADARNRQGSATATVTASRVPSSTRQPTVSSQVSANPDLGVTIEFELSPTPVSSQPISTIDLTTPIPSTISSTSAIPTQPTDYPGVPPLGTLTYPLTMTAEVNLAETRVAHYQDGVSATRTAIAAESQLIFATLTAGAPTRSSQP